MGRKTEQGEVGKAVGLGDIGTAALAGNPADIAAAEQQGCTAAGLAGIEAAELAGRRAAVLEGNAAVAEREGKILAGSCAQDEDHDDGAKVLVHETRLYPYLLYAHGFLSPSHVLSPAGTFFK